MKKIILFCISIILILIFSFTTIHGLKIIEKYATMQEPKIEFVKSGYHICGTQKSDLKEIKYNNLTVGYVLREDLKIYSYGINMNYLYFICKD